MLDLRARLRSSESTTGYFTMAASPLQLERLAALDYDYIVVDAQHGVYAEYDLPNAVRAIECGGVPAIIRIADSSAGAIGRALDTGAAGVIVPLVNDRQEAEEVVSAAQYPPAGRRSRGGARNSAYLTGTLEEVNSKVVALCMIETRDGLANVEDIAATPGIGGLYIGPNDLSIALGGYGVGDPAVEQEFDSALQRILQAGRSNGVPVIIHTASGKVAAERRRVGFTDVTIANELNHMCEAADSHLRTAADSAVHH